MGSAQVEEKLREKYGEQKAPVYNYVFTWETPVMGGYAMAYINFALTGNPNAKLMKPFAPDYQL